MHINTNVFVLNSLMHSYTQKQLPLMKMHSVSRDTQSFGQLVRRKTAQLWRQKHGRITLLAPLVVFLLTVVWSSSSPVCHRNRCMLVICNV